MTNFEHSKTWLEARMLVGDIGSPGLVGICGRCQRNHCVIVGDRGRGRVASEAFECGCPCHLSCDVIDGECDPTAD